MQGAYQYPNQNNMMQSGFGAGVLGHAGPKPEGQYVRILLTFI